MNEAAIITDLIIYLLGAFIAFLLFLVWSLLADLEQAKAEYKRLRILREDIVGSKYDNESMDDTRL